MLQERKRLLIENLIVIVLALAFIVCSFLFVIKRSNVFPIINALIFLSTIVLFKGKYSIIAVIFYSPFSSSMTLVDSKIGSFKSWIILFFLLYSLYSFIKSRGYDASCKIKYLICYSFVIIYAVFCYLLNIKSVSILQSISTLTYLSIPVSLVLNMYGQKNAYHMAIAFALSIIISNLIAFSFLYIFKSNAINFLSNYAPAYIQYYNSYPLIQFRFPGLEGDPNVNSFNILLASSCLMSAVIKRKYVFINVALIITLQVFAVLGQSKTYLLGIIIIAIIAILFALKEKKRIPIYIAFVFLFLSLSFSVAIRIPSLSQTLLRFLLFDDRVGFLEGLTTERFHIWENYFSCMSNDPIKLLFGHGIPAERLYGVDYHNVFVQLLWEFGVLGLIPFSFFIIYFFYISHYKINKSLLLTFSVVMLFSLSIQVAYFSSTYIAFYISNFIVNRFVNRKGSQNILCLNI